MTKREKDRHNRLLPGGIPRWIRCYDNGGETIDRYIVVFTGQYRHNTGGEFFYLAMDTTPCRPQGSGFQRDPAKIELTSAWDIACAIEYKADLPGECQSLVISDYKALWNL